MSETEVAETLPAPDPDEAAGGVFADRLVDYLLRPERFFLSLRKEREESHAFGLSVTPTTDTHLLLVAWVVGVAHTIDRADRMLLREQISSGVLTGAELPGWPSLWVMFLLTGILSGLATWYISGWWFRVRLRWSGAEDPDPHLARTVYMWGSFVWAVPMVLWTLVTTFSYPDYRTAYHTDDPLPWFYLGSIGWSLFIAYRGATTAFDVDPKRARIWFAVLPSVLYGAIFIGGALLAII